MQTVQRDTEKVSGYAGRKSGDKGNTMQCITGRSGNRRIHF